jgi:hypothetical protein
MWPWMNSRLLKAGHFSHACDSPSFRWRIAQWMRLGGVKTQQQPAKEQHLDTAGMKTWNIQVEITYWVHIDAVDSANGSENPFGSVWNKWRDILFLVESRLLWSAAVFPAGLQPASFKSRSSALWRRVLLWYDTNCEDRCSMDLWNVGILL